MTLDEIFNEWETDSEISPHHLDAESLKTPKLHTKYYRFLSKERMKHTKLLSDLSIIKKLKTDYYAGTLDLETMKERGYRPLRLKVLRSDIGLYLDSDEEIIQHNFKIAMTKEKIEALTDIIKMIGNRGFQIKSAIDFLRFQAGV